MFVLKSLLRPNLWQQSSNRLQLHFVLMQPNHPNYDPEKILVCDWSINKLNIKFMISFGIFDFEMQINIIRNACQNGAILE